MDETISTLCGDVCIIWYLATINERMSRTLHKKIKG